MGLTYSDVRAIVMEVLEAQADQAEISALRARVAELEGQIAGAVVATDAIERQAAAGLPQA